VAKIVIDSFGGMIPRTSPRMLPNSQAAFAANAKLTNGALRGFRAPLEGQQLTPYFVGDVRRAFPIYDVTDDALLWFARPDPDASVVGPAVLGDQHQRHYFTEPGERPRYFRLADFRADEASSFRELGVPRGNPAVVVPSGGTGDNDTRSYVYTLVGPNGEEGAPSDPFTVDGKPDGTWTVSGWSTAATQDGKLVAKVNIYRTIPGRTTADFFRVASVTLPAANYVDSRPGIEVVLEPLLESDGWDPPPEDLQGLVRHSGGFLVGFVGRDVYFSMPYRPHAWPPEFAVTSGTRWSPLPRSPMPSWRSPRDLLSLLSEPDPTPSRPWTSARRSRACPPAPSCPSTTPSSTPAPTASSPPGSPSSSSPPGTSSPGRSGGATTRRARSWLVATALIISLLSVLLAALPLLPARSPPLSCALIGCATSTD
jgi:hypothetical protein